MIEAPPSPFLRLGEGWGEGGSDRGEVSRSVRLEAPSIMFGLDIEIRLDPSYWATAVETVRAYVAPQDAAYFLDWALEPVTE